MVFGQHKHTVYNNWPRVSPELQQISKMADPTGLEGRVRTGSTWRAEQSPTGCVLAAPKAGVICPIGPIILPCLSTALWSYLTCCKLLMTMLVDLSSVCRFHHWSQFYFKDLFIFRDRKGGRKRERNINVWLPFTCPLWGAWPVTEACGICPDWELNQRPFGSQAGTQCTEPYQPGSFLRFPFPKPIDTYVCSFSAYNHNTFSSH